jgi:hypothetical protein
MGAGQSRYVEKQEEFVRANVQNFQKVLPNRYYKQIVEGKLRQLYANTDCSRDNKNSYINSEDWKQAKASVRLVYTDYH